MQKSLFFDDRTLQVLLIISHADISSVSRTELSHSPPLPGPCHFPSRPLIHLSSFLPSVLQSFGHESSLFHGFSRLTFVPSVGKMSSSRPTTAKDLSRQQLKELREAFRLFDKNNEGKIGVDELGEVMKTMGLDPSKEELQDIIDNADKNGNRKLDFDEFASFMVKKVRGNKALAKAMRIPSRCHQEFAPFRPPSTTTGARRCGRRSKFSTKTRTASSQDQSSR